MKHVFLIVFLAFSTAFSSAAELRIPYFLPEYYRPVFTNGAHPLILVNQRETNGLAHFLYSAGTNGMISVERIGGEMSACRTAFNNLLANINVAISTNKGVFLRITETELHAKVVLTNVAQELFVFLLPHSVTMWAFSNLPEVPPRFRPDSSELLRLVNQQRYEEAFRAENISMGQWQNSIREHAKALLQAGKKEESLAVFKNLLATAPFDYEAHLTFMENTPDLAAATNSARVVLKNAEDPTQISKASSFLGVEPQTLEKFPVLSTNDSGLTVVLIPLPPCNPWLLEEVASTFQATTDVPVLIRRLNREWTWGPPNRMARQRQVEGILLQLAKTNINFGGWNQDRYTNALTEALKSQDAASQYWGTDLLAKIRVEPGQYRVDAYMRALRERLNPHRASDSRTMYVGVTEANIYGDDNNYVFSVATFDPRFHEGLLSYAMMLGKLNPQSFDSRQRLVERMVKELVPAGLKQLRIPRSTDPSCPYSFSNGIERLDQKTLTLSDAVKQALKELKESPSKPSL
jgi:predicted Zn-dependent protease